MQTLIQTQDERWKFMLKHPIFLVFFPTWQIGSKHSTKFQSWHSLTLFIGFTKSGQMQYCIIFHQKKTKNCSATEEKRMKRT